MLWGRAAGEEKAAIKLAAWKSHWFDFSPLCVFKWGAPAGEEGEERAAMCGWEELLGGRQINISSLPQFISYQRLAFCEHEHLYSSKSTSAIREPLCVWAR